MLTYIREKSNPLRILAWGYVGANGLGEFDPDIYEEITGVSSLPLGYSMIEPVSIIDEINTIFATLPLGSYSPAQKSVIYTMKTNIDSALIYQDYETVRYVIENAEIIPSSSYFDSVKIQMLAIIP